MAAEDRSAEAKLVELAFIFIIVLGAGLLVTRELARHSETNHRKVTIERMLVIEEALARYMIDSGGILPTTDQGLQALIEEPTSRTTSAAWNGPYLETKELLRDAWGREFHYFCPGRPLRGYEGMYHPYSLFSYGANGAEGGDQMDADIYSWDRTTMIP